MDTRAPRLPYVLLNCAISLDGYLDDPRGPRLVLSSPEDLDAVDGLRAAADAILIGGGTARRDNPELLVKAAVRRTARVRDGLPNNPLRVIVTQSGRLPSDLKMLNDGAAPTRVYCEAGGWLANRKRLSECVEVVALDRFGLAEVLTHLKSTGVERVLIEGGAWISSEVIAQDLYDEIRLAIAPVVVGSSAAQRFAGHARLETAARHALSLVETSALGDTAVVHFARASGDFPPRSRFTPRGDAGWLAEAIQISRRCTPVARAFSVGAIIVDRDGLLVATGYSRELDVHCHAEEVALRKASLLGRDVTGATLYTSMEPCSVRLSGREPCTDIIARSGIRRVVYAMREPPTFVRCEGHARLVVHGLEVQHISELTEFAEHYQKHLTS